MCSYEFNLMGQTDKAPANWMEDRPVMSMTTNLETAAKYFVAQDSLKDVINTAIALGEPLLLTGEPGIGKTQVAYYIAYKLYGYTDREQTTLQEKPLHFVVKSSSRAQDLYYEFDTIRYFQKAHLQYLQNQSKPKKLTKENKKECRTFNSLAVAIRAANYEKQTKILLIDEIDKAPRDFPNDLLNEIDQMSIYIPETEENIQLFKNRQQYKPIVIITSNEERRLPEAFLRRCIYYNIEFEEKILRQAISERKPEYENLADEFIDFAISRLIALRATDLRKRPCISEFLNWLRILAIAVKQDVEKAQRFVNKRPPDFKEFPFLGILLKDRKDHPKGT